MPTPPTLVGFARNRGRCRQRRQRHHRAADLAWASRRATIEFDERL